MRAGVELQQTYHAGTESATRGEGGDVEEDRSKIVFGKEGKEIYYS